MSQRRQEARRARQERRRLERREVRVDQRRAEVPERKLPAPAGTRPRTTFWTKRNRLMAAGALGALILLVAGFWIFRSVTAALPGEKFASQGNDHLADIDAPHEPYNSNPPTSGPHLPPVPRPGVYTRPHRPEELGHFMEHGGVWLLYNCPEGCEGDVSTLQTIVNSAISDGRPAAVAPYPTMETRFAAVAWQYLLRQDELDRGELNNFLNRHACRYNPEGGPYCSGVRGSVATSPAGSGTTLPVTQLPFSVFGSPTPAPAGTPGATVTPPTPAPSP